MTRRRVAVVAAVALASAGTAAVVEASGMGERIPAGVRVDGLPVGGLSPAEATRRVEAYARVAEPGETWIWCYVDGVEVEVVPS